MLQNANERQGGVRSSLANTSLLASHPTKHFRRPAGSPPTTREWMRREGNARSPPLTTNGRS